MVVGGGGGGGRQWCRCIKKNHHKMNLKRKKWLNIIKCHFQSVSATFVAAYR